MAGKVTGKGPRKPRASSTKSAGTGGNGRPLSPDDNLSPEEKAKRAAEEKRQREEAEAIQLLSVVGRVRVQLTKVEAKRAELKTEQDALNTIFRGAKVANKDFERGRIMELIEDTKPESRRDVVHNEEVRARFRRLMGLPVGDKTAEELDLESRLPEALRDGNYWEGVGYSAGISGGDQAAPKDCVLAGHGNRYDEGFKAGQAKLGAAMVAEAEAKKPPAPPPPEETEVERRARESRETSAAKRALENLGKGKPAEGEGGEVVDLAAARDAKAGPEGQTLATDAKAVGEQAAADFKADNPEFSEASPEELAGQKPRAAVQAAKEGGEDADEVTV